MMETKKVVLFPIEVPITDFCWDRKVHCEHFDNTGGTPGCTLSWFVDLNYDKEGKVQKPDDCKKLRIN
jgi:hypothetical protein